ncbi:hypothetical protein [Pseudomonas aeruginosa]|uniref:hypothetical protein n=1 Tax=Pseudomonas aeruginosa TaxID=287 RepID=UPI0021F14364|nr:hypothetical protein [Pseudomonas aeruginosa]MCV6451575.1 hypothetical protein [Pseudomonas aeruginosa]HCE8379570.1 hypothetical protein [Pseudomonas aeruginosa]
MSEVKRFWCDEARNIRCVREDDFDALEAEAQALRDEVAALRARAVVLPSVDNVMNIVMRYQWNEKTNVTGTTNWAANLGMKVVEEVKRLNGLTVSEGLLRRLARPADRYDEVFTLDRHEAAEELRALLSKQE